MPDLSKKSTARRQEDGGPRGAQALVGGGSYRTGGGGTPVWALMGGNMAAQSICGIWGPFMRPPVDSSAAGPCIPWACDESQRLWLGGLEFGAPFAWWICGKRSPPASRKERGCGGRTGEGERCGVERVRGEAAADGAEANASRGAGGLRGAPRVCRGDSWCPERCPDRPNTGPRSACNATEKSRPGWSWAALLY